MDKHSIESLRYRLFTGPVDIAPLKVLASRHIAWLDWLVTFSILGASHAVSLTRGNDTICELLTCAPPVTDCESIEDRIPDGTRLNITVKGLEWSWESSVERCGSSPILSYPADRLLTARFAAGIDAVTMIGWSAVGLGLQIETVHTYPEEGRLIRTCTRIQRSADR